MTYKEYLKQQQKEQPKNISVAQASKLIGKNPQFVRCAMRNNIINIGTCVKREGCTKYDYYINPTLLYKYLGKEQKKFDLFH